VTVSVMPVTIVPRWRTPGRAMRMAMVKATPAIV
jgi:hypothetical protein